MLYQIQPGDTLYKLAQRFGTTIQQLVELNQLDNPDLLEVGQVLLIPEEETVEYEPKNFACKVVDGLLLILFTDRSSYQPGDVINLNFIKVNISQSPITLNYRDGQRVEFQAYKNGDELWTWSEGQFFTQETREISLISGRALVYNKQWNQTNQEEEQVKPGIYKLVGWNVARQVNKDWLSVFVKIR